MGILRHTTCFRVRERGRDSLFSFWTLLPSLFLHSVLSQLYVGQSEWRINSSSAFMKLCVACLYSDFLDLFPSIIVKYLDSALLDVSRNAFKSFALMC